MRRPRSTRKRARPARSLRQTAEAQTTKLEVVPPGAFFGEVPEAPRWT